MNDTILTDYVIKICSPFLYFVSINNYQQKVSWENAQRVVENNFVSELTVYEASQHFNNIPQLVEHGTLIRSVDLTRKVGSQNYLDHFETTRGREKAYYLILKKQLYSADLFQILEQGDIQSELLTQDLSFGNTLILLFKKIIEALFIPISYLRN